MSISLNSYGQPIVSPEYFDGAHVVNPGPAGMPPVCSCGWTEHSGFTMYDHLRDMGEIAEPIAPSPSPYTLPPPATRSRPSMTQQEALIAAKLSRTLLTARETNDWAPYMEACRESENYHRGAASKLDP